MIYLVYQPNNNKIINNNLLTQGKSVNKENSDTEDPKESSKLNLDPEKIDCFHFLRFKIFRISLKKSKNEYDLRLKKKIARIKIIPYLFLDNILFLDQKASFFI